MRHTVGVDTHVTGLGEEQNYRLFHFQDFIKKKLLRP